MASLVLKKLQVNFLQEFSVSEKTIEYLANLFQNNKKSLIGLDLLFLSGNGINEEKAALIGKAISKLSYIVYLKLDFHRSLTSD